ncbi:S8 family peptidase [Halostagnicola sp. A-GB9-2]|uniref:S8 family peptidase n=1 Tax=Halostagnicola sp. A-GB9-2 TaxID=3048066 RepID=UPI0024C0A407|nr:S8 family peptidase [Halostagnicola sp. A-GB9-2]MDJ1433179.1 S8 family serine peptidase [Halostagnicola sp. A-GB9-2]
MTERGSIHSDGDESTRTNQRNRGMLDWVPRCVDSMKRSLTTAVVPFLVCFVSIAHRGISRRNALGVLGTGLASVLGITPATGDGTADEADTDRYVVGLEEGTSSASVSRKATQIHRSLDLSSNGGVVVASFDDKARQEFEARSDVRYVERDHIRRPQIHSTVEPADTVDLGTGQKSPWGVERVGATDFHDSTEGSDGGSVAVLDSGIDPEHESLEVADGEAFTECSGSTCEAEWDDEIGHGTHCAGTIGALDNGAGVVGVAPGCDIYALKVLAGDGSGYDSDIAAAIEWCADNDIDVINLSLGGSDEAQVLEDALQYAYERGLLVVAAAGNDGSAAGVDYPAGYDECIAVGATDDRDEIPEWSARGDTVELVAPGADVLSTQPGDEYVYLSGTSMSTPHISGIGAQLMSQGLPHAEDTTDFDDPGGVRGILRETAEDLDFDDDEQGYGLLNAFDALDELDPISTEDVTDIRTNTATFTGMIMSLEDTGAVDGSFQWRESGGSEWDETESQSLEGGEEFTAVVDELNPDTEYDVRATLDDGDETTAANVVTFTTGIDGLAVETGDIEVDDHRTVQAVGELTGLGDDETVEVAFQTRRAGDDEWETTDSSSLEAIGIFEDDISGLEPETEYEIQAVVESDGETATGNVATVETDPEPGLPTIERFELTDDSTDQFVRCNVHWDVSDRDDALELVATELQYADDEEVIHRIGAEVEGGTESGIHTVRNSDRFEGAGEAYDVTLSVTDAEGNVTEETERIELDERSPAPAIDRFEITADDFLGSPEAVVEWEVSDEGAELDGVELEMRLVGDSSVVDSASSMARDDEAAGTDSLTDRDGSEGETEYDVTIRVIDYFEQTTEETTRVMLGD